MSRNARSTLATQLGDERTQEKNAGPKSALVSPLRTVSAAESMSDLRPSTSQEWDGGRRERVVLGRGLDWLGRGFFFLGLCILLLLILGLFHENVGLSFAFVSPASAAEKYSSPYSIAEFRAEETTDEAKLRELRTEEAKQLKLLLARRQPQNRKAELYYRLAELHVEAYQSTFLLEGKVHEKRLKDGKKATRIDRSTSRPHLRLAIDSALELLRLKIPFERLDRVYYFLAYGYDELGEQGQAHRYYTDLITRFPASALAGDAYRQLGEEAFEKAQFSKSVTLLELALKKAKPESQPRIAHKLAWAYYRTRNYEGAVQSMKNAISLTKGRDEKFLSLKEEALRDLAIFLTETGRVEEALAYFKDVAGDQNFYAKTLERLGRQYERNAEPARAAQVYESILKTQGKSEASFRVVAKLVDLDLRRGKLKEALGRLRGLEVPKQPSDVESQTALTNLRAMVRRTGTENHDQFRKKGQRSSLETAEGFYTAYLNSFLAVEDPRNETPEIQMYLAEVKRELGKSGEASAYYRKVLDSKDARYAREAGALWTASLSEAIHKGQAQGSGSALTGPGKLEAEFVEASDKLSDALGNTSEGRASALRSAQVLAGYRTSHHEAQERIKKILAAWPSSPQAVTAARLWLQMSIERLPKDDSSAESLKSGEWEKLSQVLQEIRSNARLLAADQDSGAKLKGQLNELDLRMKARQIRGAEREMNWVAAGKGYETLAVDSRDREVSEKAFAGAVSAYTKAEDDLAVDRVAAAWLKKFPGSPRGADALRGAATLNLVAGRFSSAQKLFERIGRNGDVASWVTSARILYGSGDKAGAYRSWVSILEQSKNSPLRWQVALELALGQEQERMDAEASRAYKYCVAGPIDFEAECAARLGDLYARVADWVQAKTFWRRSAALKNKATGVGQAYAQYARWRLAESAEKDIPIEPITAGSSGSGSATSGAGQAGEVSLLKRSIDARLSAAESLKRNYSEVIELGGPFGIAALNRQALFLSQFSKDLGSVAKLPAEKQIASQIQQSALNAWAQAYDRAVASETLSSALPAIGDELAFAKSTKVHLAQGARGRLWLMGSIRELEGASSEAYQDLLKRVRERLKAALSDAALWNDYGNALKLTGATGVAKLAYERALELQPKNAAALNNRAILLLSDEWRLGGREDVLSTLAAQEGLKRAIRGR
jgi:Flp pilus assembly protein TadD